MAGGKACLLVSNLFPPALGGSAEVYAALARHAQSEIVVLASSHDHQTGMERKGWRDADRAATYPIWRVKCVRPFFRNAYSGLSYRLHEVFTAFKLVFTVMRLARRYRVAAICVADDESLGWLAWLSRYVLGRRTLIYCHGDDLHGGEAEVPRRRRWLMTAHRIVAANRYAAGLLESRFGVGQDRIALIENGVDLALFHPGTPSASLVARLGLAGRQVLLTVTRLVPRKGVDKMLHAMPAVAAHFPGALYVIAGDGPQRAELEALANALGIAERVIFLGALPHAQTAELYRAADVVVLPNREEQGEADGLPLVFLEAAACAKPVIGGKAGGTAEAVVDGVNGLVIDGRDVQAIAGAVCGLLADPERCRAMGEEGARLARNWGWEARARKFLAACRV
ncbi:MAG TPA: glycosyltransferase family 4 protein [Rhizomicrobium sp.]|nr:glycosyltransferase family 4 protein [Rhizomicrobium sp.]